MNLLKNTMKNKTLLFMSAPAIIILFLFQYVPIFGLTLAFKEFDFSLGIFKSPWVGLENFKFLFLSGGAFWRLTRNTIGYYLLFTVFGTIFEVSIAIGINEFVKKKVGRVFQSVMIMPTFLSYMAVSYIVYALLSTDTGILNQVVNFFGGDSIRWYFDDKYWPVILLLVKLWKNSGYGSVLYLSVLSGIDQELYEAASLDGASNRQKLRYITIPMLLPMVGILTLLGLGNIMHSDTGLFYQVTKNMGSLYGTTQVLDSYVLSSITSSSTNTINFGMIAATTFYQSVVGCVLLLITNRFIRKVAPDSALF